VFTETFDGGLLDTVDEKVDCFVFIALGSVMETSSVLVISTSSDWSSWANVIVTGMAVLAAIYAGWQARLLLKIEIKRELDRDLSLVSEQAKQVSSWSKPILNSSFNNSNFTERGIEAVVVNQSKQAIYDVEIYWWFSGDLEHQNRIDLVPPGESAVFELPSYLLDKFSGEVNFKDFVEPYEDAKESCMAICDLLRIGVRFRDAENRTWLRDQTGLLKRT
jgi:hypothetical protein